MICHYAEFFPQLKAASTVFKVSHVSNQWTHAPPPYQKQLAAPLLATASSTDLYLT